MSATDELRRLLDERGVEWSSIGGDTSWEDSRGWTATAEADSVDGSMVYVTALMTPEQAIAATLGNDGVERSKNGVAERDQLKDENDKLRELVKDMWHLLFDWLFKNHEVPWKELEAAHDRLCELGMEVDG